MASTGWLSPIGAAKPKPVIGFLATRRSAMTRNF